MIDRSTFALACVLVVVACRPARHPAWQLPVSAAGIVPAPASLTMTRDAALTLTPATTVVIDSGNAEVARTAEMLAALLRPSTGFAVPVATADTAPAGAKIALRLAADQDALGDEGYALVVTRDSARIVARRPAGLFHGVQTLRQLLPPAIESHMAISPMDWRIPGVSITDRPRFVWRGAMLDVARHFFTVDEVKQYIDLLALYKLNVLHLHLSDDQGWRIEIRSRPNLARIGGTTEVGGGPGGFYTQADYSEIVRYAQERYVMVVPEIDMPGHTNAALVAYPELSCGRRPPALYTGTEVGWSTFCVDKEQTYALVDDIVREIAALTPGPYLHMGGDEVEALTPAEYASFVERVQGIIARHGKRMIGWEEIAKARLQPTTVVQLWRSDSAAAATQPGTQLIVSPGPRTYLDMKYTTSTELGLQWAGLIELRDAYEWDPPTYMKGASGREILGIEAPLWSETLRNMTAAQYLAMPRLPALAEVGWSPQTARRWDDFRARIAAHAPRWTLLGVNYYRSPQVSW